MASVYTLNNGAKGVEAERLEAQHARIFVPLTGGLIPEHVRGHLKSVSAAPAVADIATGTGCWLRDLSAELPSSARLDGFDFDTSKFSDRLPPNVKLSYANMLEPFAKELHGQYDLVHVRLVKFAVKANQWGDLATNLMTLLKPGGWLLWEEMAYSSWAAVPMTKAFFDWISVDVKYAISVGRDPNIGVTLPRRVKTAGYVNCSQQTYSTFAMEDAEIRNLAGHGLAAAASQSLHGIVDRGGFEHIQTHEEVTKLIDTINGEIDDGVSEIGFEFVWTIGQKPES